jgi:uncharacterized protein YjiS (DUF1127 family)
LPFGEVRLSVRVPAPDKSRPASRFWKMLRAAAEWLAREQLRHAAREIDPRIIDEIAVSNPEAAREIRKLFDL